LDGEGQRRAISPLSEERGLMNLGSILNSSVILAAANN
jgi:hypothetical protein